MNNIKNTAAILAALASAAQAGSASTEIDEKVKESIDALTKKAGGQAIANSCSGLSVGVPLESGPNGPKNPKGSKT